MKIFTDTKIIDFEEAFFSKNTVVFQGKNFQVKRIASIYDNDLSQYFDNDSWVKFYELVEVADVQTNK